MVGSGAVRWGSLPLGGAAVPGLRGMEVEKSLSRLALTTIGAHGGAALWPARPTLTVAAGPAALCLGGATSSGIDR